MNHAQKDGSVNSDVVLLPLASFQTILGFTASELRVYFLLIALSEYGGGPFAAQTDQLRTKYKNTIGSRISERKLDAALGVLQFAKAITIDREDGGMLTITVPSAIHLVIPEQQIEKISRENREGGYRGEGKRDLQGSLFSQIGDHEQSKLAREVTEKCLRAWANRTGRNPSRAKATASRIRMVNARLQEGWKPDDLYRAVAGLCYSDWHHENAQDKIELALRSAERVEFCHDLWLRFAPPDKVAEFEKTTGEVVAHRATEIEQQKKEDREREVYAEQIAEAGRLRQEQNSAAREQERDDQEWESVLSQGTEGD